MYCNTFSIVARCPDSGRFGVAISTAVPAVGSLCSFAKAGVGAIATQAWVNPSLGVKGLALLEEGLSAEQTLKRLLAEDDGRNSRQLGIVDASGQSIAYTGSRTVRHQGHTSGPNYAIQGNMLKGPETLQAMEDSFCSSEGELAERLMRALEAGQAAGGDKRGKVSAALTVVDTEGFPYCELRVDEHADPVAELRRIFNIHRIGLMSCYNKWVSSIKEGKKVSMRELFKRD
ncbi:hypothetical protein BEP19_12135 [Ammoniphilus oxalaticus]|uniref:Fimbrial assembly protein FimA n=1 Tax=Ammoniphilus oxalaticus TaxID=66863 RepID=A0A419SGS0_9BACL|nr:DUF1028 domain-containing protein [Ammoniphilus oxalaticus]RKD22973.1 hypothetical protein BEP19_12135 [Ammoniphilus oxalaticus]